RNIDPSKIAAAAEHAVSAVPDDAAQDTAAERVLAYDNAENTAAEDAAVQHGAVEQGAAEDDVAEDPLATEISNIHARWLMTPREDLRGQSPREVLLARQDFLDFDLHTRAMQWSFLGEGPPCLPHDSHAYRFAGFGTHEFVIYYDLVRHLICTLVADTGSPTSNVQSPTSNVQGSIQVGMSHGQEGGHAQLIATLDQIKSNWLESPQPDYGGRTPAILIDNERKRLPEAMRPRDMIIDDDCPMCQMFGDETTPLGMGVGFWHLDGCNMDEDFAFSSYKTREEWEAENRRQEEFRKEFDRKWEERQERIARGEPIEFDPILDPDPFPDFELDVPTLTSSEDEEELAQ
ncbi:MAG: hypothetical protein ABR501_15140, partial [Pyrinomonadaceae bacterium]